MLKETSCRDVAFDFCAVAMTVLVLAITAIFFLSFTVPIAVVITPGSTVNGVLVDASCSFGSITESRLIRSGNTTVLLLLTLDVTAGTKFLIKQSDVLVATQATDACTVPSVRRTNVAHGASAGGYSVALAPVPADQMLNFGCANYTVVKGDRFYLGFYSDGADSITNYVVESDVPIDEGNVVGISVFAMNLQIVAGPAIDLNTQIMLGLNFDDLIARSLEIQINCQYKPGFDFSSASFGLNTATALVGGLCLLTQLEFYAHKYRRHRGTRSEVAHA
jgi:hypothetical protein